MTDRRFWLAATAVLAAMVLSLIIAGVARAQCVTPPVPGPDGVSVLDYLDEQMRAEVLAGYWKNQVLDVPDVAPCIQEALDAVAAARARTVRVPAGVYPVATTISVPSGARLVGEGLALFPRASQLVGKPRTDECEDCTDAGYPLVMLDVAGTTYTELVGLHLDGGYQLTGEPGGLYAVQADCATSLRVEDVAVLNLGPHVDVAGVEVPTAGIHGGGLLYPELRRLLISTEGYAIQATRDAASCPTYYGIGGGGIYASQLNSWLGVHVDGTITIQGCGFEPAHATGAVLRVSAAGNEHVDILGNYWEVHRDPGVGVSLMRLDVASGRVAGNSLHGPPDLGALTPAPAWPPPYCGAGEVVGIDVYQAAGLEVTGNELHRLDCGVRFASAPTDGELVVDANTYVAVRGRVAATWHHGPTSWPVWRGIVTVPGAGRLAYGARVSSIPYVASATTPIDLSVANAVDVVGPGVMAAPVGAYPGQRLELLVSVPGVTIPAGSWGLASGRDLAAPLGAVLSFVVDRSGVVREVGATSVLLELRAAVGP